ncbi:uncharacterized protein [Cicer arietinum]|uniref:Uncharacterized protein At2g17340-like isoform X1 n=1 Tax=Cicer arietinum TaxID=3827 RepID=A0A3Q7XKS6_CICAR|nr:uncharacterized protein At2g17340-like isoform X1 [Cicer arietinum]
MLKVGGLFPSSYSLCLFSSLNFFNLAEVFARDGVSFSTTCENLLPGPWIIDDLDTLKLKWSNNSGKKVIIFVDNYGGDIILGDQLAIAKETGRRLGMGTNMYPSSSLLGDNKDQLGAISIDDLIENSQLNKDNSSIIIGL